MATKQPGTLRREQDGFAVTFERYFPYDTMTVWDAITHPDKLALWFFPVTPDLRPGGKMEIRFPDGTPSYCTITQVEPGRLFEFIWESMDEGPDELARWELFPEGDSGCKLVLNYTRLIDRYAISVPTGWHNMLDHLEEVLQGRRQKICPMQCPDGMVTSISWKWCSMAAGCLLFQLKDGRRSRRRSLKNIKRYYLLPNRPRVFLPLPHLRRQRPFYLPPLFLSALSVV